MIVPVMFRKPFLRLPLVIVTLTGIEGLTFSQQLPYRMKIQLTGEEYFYLEYFRLCLNYSFENVSVKKLRFQFLSTAMSY